MSTATIEHRDHPVTAAVAQIRAELDSLAGAGVWSMSPDQLAATLPEVTRLKAQVTELELRVAHHAARVGLGAQVGAADTAAWWANTTRMTRPEAHRLAKLAEALDTGHQPVRDAMATGNLLLDQAQVIVAAIDALPDDLVDPETIAKAEAHLVGLAADHDAKALRVLGRRILDVIAPQIAEAEQRRALEREEEHARQAARFTLADDGHGQCHGRFTIPSLHGAILNKALLAIAAPKHQTAAGQGAAPEAHTQGGTGPLGGRVAAPLRLGHAFLEFLETYPTDLLPHAGGVNATVVITTGYDPLTGALTTAGLDMGVHLSASETRRLACSAGILPMILNGKSGVLDMGRTARFHTKPQRLAMALRDGGCTAEGCDWPPGMCHAHHNIPWSKGGTTSVDDGRLLCPRHHSFAHHPKYQMKDTGNGKVSFHWRP